MLLVAVPRIGTAIIRPNSGARPELPRIVHRPGHHRPQLPRAPLLEQLVEDRRPLLGRAARRWSGGRQRRRLAGERDALKGVCGGLLRVHARTQPEIASPSCGTRPGRHPDAPAVVTDRRYVRAPAGAAGPPTEGPADVPPAPPSSAASCAARPGPCPSDLTGADPARARRTGAVRTGQLRHSSAARTSRSAASGSATRPSARQATKPSGRTSTAPSGVVPCFSAQSAPSSGARSSFGPVPIM